jgi:hypothetical protein
MALKSNQPIEKDGKIYDNLAANLALSPMPHANRLGVSIAVRLTPFLLGEEGPEKLEDEAKALVYGDATAAAQTDPALAQFLLALERAAQAFIDAKGI